MEKDIKKKMTIDKLAVMVASGFESVEKRMVTKDDLKKDLFDLKLELKTDIHDLRTEIKSFKEDTGNSVKEIKDDMTNLEDTDMHHDKRIEKLEGKVFT